MDPPKCLNLSRLYLHPSLTYSREALTLSSSCRLYNSSRNLSCTTFYHSISTPHIQSYPHISKMERSFFNWVKDLFKDSQKRLLIPLRKLVVALWSYILSSLTTPRLSLFSSWHILSSIKFTTKTLPSSDSFNLKDTKYPLSKQSTWCSHVSFFSLTNQTNTF
jgi:hypothetical protein